MASATYDVLEIRIVIEPELTHLYVLCGPDSDGTGIVQGWHKKTIPPSVPAMEEMDRAMKSQGYLLWDRGSPDARRS